MAARTPQLDQDAELLARLRREADAGDLVARALLNAPRDPMPTTPEEAAALGRAKAAHAAGEPSFTAAQVRAIIDAKRRAEEG